MTLLWARTLTTTKSSPASQCTVLGEGLDRLTGAQTQKLTKDVRGETVRRARKRLTQPNLNHHLAHS